MLLQGAEHSALYAQFRPVAPPSLLAEILAQYTSESSTLLAEILSQLTGESSTLLAEILSQFTGESSTLLAEILARFTGESSSLLQKGPTPAAPAPQPRF